MYHSRRLESSASVRRTNIEQRGSSPVNRSLAPEPSFVSTYSGQSLRSLSRPQIRSIDELTIVRGNVPADLLAQWHALEWDAAMTPFQRCDWLEQWRLHCGTSTGTEMVTAFGCAAGHLVLVLPFFIERRRGLTALTWRGYQLNDYCGPIATRALLRGLECSEALGLIRFIVKTLGGMDIVYMTKQPQSLARLPNPFVLPRSEIYHVGAHAIQLGESWGTFYAERRSRNSRRRFKDKVNALGKLGDLRFQIAAQPAEKSRLVELCIALKSEQLRHLGYFDPFAEHCSKQLLSAYARIAKDDSFWVASLMLSDRPIAVAFGFADDAEWLLYQIAMERGEMARFSPGTILLQHLMEHCIGAGIKRFDLSLGDEDYKMAWCDEHTRLHLSVVPVSLLGHAYALGLPIRSRLRRQIVARPLVHAAAKRMRALLAGQAALPDAVKPLFNLFRGRK